MLSLDFLENSEYFDRIDPPTEKQVLFNFKSVDGMRQMRGIIGIPLNQEGICWNRYFEKGRKVDPTAEPLPPWFEDLFKQSVEYTEKKHRLKRIFS